MKTHQQQQIWDTNYEKIVNFIKKCNADGRGATVQEIQRAVKLSRKNVCKYLKKAMGPPSDVVKDKRLYFSREFRDRKKKAEETYTQILGIRGEDLSVRAGLPWFGRSDFTLMQFAPEKYLDSGKLVHSDVLRARSKLGNNKRAKLEALNYTDAFLRNVKIEIRTSIKEVKLQSGHRVTKITAFLPFLQKVEKGWDAEVYDKAVWIMYYFLRELALPSGVSPSDEIVINIRLKPHDLMIRLFDAMYTFKKLEDLQRTKKIKGSEYTSIFPDLQKTHEYQDLEKAWQTQDEKQRQEMKIFEQNPIKYILEHAKQAEDPKP